MNALRAAVVLALAVAVAVVAVVMASSGDSRPAPEPAAPLPAGSADLMRIDIDPEVREGTGRLPRNFLGFSAEVPFAERIMGTPGAGTNHAAEGIFAGIRAARSGAPVLRVGGSSAETTWWNPRGRPRPPGIRFDVNQPYLDQLRGFSARNGTPLVLNLSLVAEAVAPVVGYVKAANRTLGPRIRAYELGNEPDAYAGKLSFVDRGRTVPQRPAGYGFADFMGEWDARARALRAGAGPIALAGPSVCCAPAFLSRLAEFARAQRTRLGMLTLHEYFGSACPGVRPGTPQYPTRQKLLGEAEMTRIVSGFRDAVAVGRQIGRPVAVTETNSFACGGQPGVSDTFSSALWAPEYLMRSASVGIAGMYFHVFGKGYTPFDFTYAAGRGWSVRTRPLYYGLLLFARATAGRATILPAAAVRSRVRSGAPVVAFPTVDRRGTVRVLVLAKGGSRGGLVRVRSPRGAARARLTRLTAPGLGARHGVTLAGQSVPAGSRTGRLEGRLRARRIARRGGAYRFRMPAAGAALLEIPVSGR